VRDLIWYFFSVGALVVALLAGVLWQFARPLSARPRRFLVLVAGVYTVITCYGVSHAVGRLLTVGLAPFAADDVPRGRTAIVVLGSGSFTARDWSGSSYSIAGPMDATRVLEAVRVYRLIDADWVISSGGKPRPTDPHEASGVTMGESLAALGVPAPRIVVETKSRNTYEEAIVVAPMLQQLQVQHVVLVTSATHMRRSLGAFRTQGVRAIPAIAADPYVASSWIEWIVPSDLGLWKSASVVHEIIGLGYYAARGWYTFP
jgi:uncharacterized SAM-binding protein YcdF (DUF218 family)